TRDQCWCKTRQDTPQHFLGGGLATAAGQGNDFELRILLTTVCAQPPQCQTGIVYDKLADINIERSTDDRNLTAACCYLCHKIMGIKALALQRKESIPLFSITRIGQNTFDGVCRFFIIEPIALSRLFKLFCCPRCK